MSTQLTNASEGEGLLPLEDAAPLDFVASPSYFDEAVRKKLGTSLAVVQPDSDFLTSEDPTAPQYLTRNTTIIRKANAAIHSERMNSGSVTLLELNLFNGLLKVALDQLNGLNKEEFDKILDSNTVVVFQATPGSLSRYANGYHTNDYGRLYAGLDSLLSHKVRWNKCREPGETVTTCTTLISQYEIVRRSFGTQGKDRTELIRWAWMPAIFKMLFNPVSYTRLNLNFTSSFRSKYTLLLYENCIRYQNIGKTRTEDMQFWRALIVGDSKKYTESREFIRLLNDCIDEINRFSPSMVELSIEITRGRFNRITGICFHLKKKRQESLDLDMPAGVDPTLLVRLRQWKLSEYEINQLLVNHDVMYLENCVHKVQIQLNKQAIENVKNYFLTTVHSTDSERKFITSFENLVDKKVAKTTSKPIEPPVETLTTAVDWLQSLSAERQSEIMSDATDTLKSSIEKRGLGNKGVRKMVNAWLLSSGKFIPEPGEAS